MAYDELALIIFRIEYLAPLVSTVVIAESKLTHKGETKNLYISENLSENIKNKYNIIFLELDISHFPNGWGKEIASRERLADYVYESFPDSYFILSDVDEIPSIKQLESLQTKKGIFHFRTPTYYRRANWALKDSHRNWSRGVMGKTSQLPKINGGRMMNLPIIDIPNDNGVHLSYLESRKSSALNKMSRVLDHKLDFSNVMKSSIMSLADRAQVDHLGRARNEGFGVLEIVEFVNLPPILKALHTKNPDVFDFKINEEYPKRLLSSIFLSTLVNQARLLRKFEIEDSSVIGRLRSFRVIPLFVLESFHVFVRAIRRKLYR